MPKLESGCRVLLGLRTCDNGVKCLFPSFTSLFRDRVPECRRFPVATPNYARDSVRLRVQDFDHLLLSSFRDELVRVSVGV